MLPLADVLGDISRTFLRLLLVSPWLEGTSSACSSGLEGAFDVVLRLALLFWALFCAEGSQAKHTPAMLAALKEATR